MQVTLHLLPFEYTCSVTDVGRALLALQTAIKAAQLTKQLFTILQDLMDAQIIPADTDYRMFSYKYYGSLPGVDIAFLLDSSAYHTHNDSPDRIRPGTVQVACLLMCCWQFPTPFCISALCAVLGPDVDVSLPGPKQ